LLSQPHFRAAYDFLLLRCESGEVDSQLGLWWDEFQDASEERRVEMLLPDEVVKKRRRRKKSGTTVPAGLPVT
jgi:poly(A) polymerase